MLIVVCGATATGKSGLALELAQKLNTIIISADSRQVYREFNIGTAKPTSEEQKLIPHYLIDVCEPIDTLTVADYQVQVNSIIEKNLDDSTPLLLVGGTGLYIRSIIQGLKIPRVAPHADLRHQLTQLGQSQLYQMLQQVDPIAAAKIHSHDQVRTLRALEVFYVTGQPISTQQGENPPPYPILQIGLDNSNLTNLIQERTEQMIKAGLVEEVAYLSAKYGADLPLLQTLGYAEIQKYLSKNITLAEAIDLIILHTRQFAKRQRTWFRRDSRIHWFDSNNPDLVAQVWLKILEFQKFCS